jgi:GntR family transcriptional regulator / MocR family aminotransferase
MAKTGSTSSFVSVPELLVPDWDPTLPRRTQLEASLRNAIRVGRLRPGSRLPSSRALAAELGVSRRLVVEVYEQLAAEGHLVARRGSGTRVAPQPLEPHRAAPVALAGAVPSPVEGIDLFAGAPDPSLFPRRAWARALRRAVDRLPDARLSYGEFGGAVELRIALAEHLGRVRGAAAEPGQIVATAGYQQALRVFCGLVRSRDARRVAVEDPGYPVAAWIVESEGLEAVAVPVDDDGVDVGALRASGAEAAVVTPAHSMPLGAVLAAERRRELVSWARDRGTLVLEDDYDAELRHNRGPAGCLQGLAPDVVVLAGSVSKTLAPALRMGWLCLPGELVAEAITTRAAADQGGPRFEELALAELIASGGFDRHVRAARHRYREKRSLLLGALRGTLPETKLRGIAAGLHAVLELPPGVSEQAVVDRVAREGVHVQGLATFTRSHPQPPGLVLGYGLPTERKLREAVATIAAAIEAERTADGRGVR